MASGPPSYRSLHVRIRSSVVDDMHVIAAYDSERMDRKVYMTELLRGSARRYIDERIARDPELARRIALARSARVRDLFSQ